MLSKIFGLRKQQARRMAKRRDLGHESLESRELLAGDTMRAMAADLDTVEVVDTEVVDGVGDDDGVGDTILCHSNHHRGNSVNRTIAGLEAGLVNNDLPGDLTAEDVQGIIDGLNAAIAAGDTVAVETLLGEVSAAKKLDSIRAEIAGYQADLDAATAAAGEGGEVTLFGLPGADIQTQLDAANQGIADGDLAAADVAVDVIEAAQRAEATAARNLARYTAKVAKLQASIDAVTAADPLATTYKGVPLAEAQMYATDAQAAIDAGDSAGAKAQLDALSAAEQLVRDTARITAKVDGLNADLAAADAADPVVTVYKGIDIEVARSFAADAAAAIAAGDIASASAALSDLNDALHLAHEVAEVTVALANWTAPLWLALQARSASE